MRQSRLICAAVWAIVLATPAAAPAFAGSALQDQLNGDRITVSRMALGTAIATPRRTGIAALLARAGVRRAGLGGLLALGVLGFVLIARFRRRRIDRGY